MRAMEAGETDLEAQMLGELLFLEVVGESFDVAEVAELAHDMEDHLAASVCSGSSFCVSEVIMGSTGVIGPIAR